MIDPELLKEIKGRANAAELPNDRYVNDLKADVRSCLGEMETLQRSLDAATDLNRKSICVYCGTVQDIGNPENVREVMAKHIVGCEQHPLNQIVNLLAAITTLVEHVETCPGCCSQVSVYGRQILAEIEAIGRDHE